MISKPENFQTDPEKEANHSRVNTALITWKLNSFPELCYWYVWSLCLNSKYQILNYSSVEQMKSKNRPLFSAAALTFSLCTVFPCCMCLVDDTVKCDHGKKSSEASYFLLVPSLYIMQVCTQTCISIYFINYSYSLCWVAILSRMCIISCGSCNFLKWLIRIKGWVIKII